MPAGTACGKRYLKLSLLARRIALFPAASQSELAPRKLVKRKVSGKLIEHLEPTTDRSNVIDLMAALRQGVDGGRGRRLVQSRKSRPRRAAGMLANRGFA